MNLLDEELKFSISGKELFYYWDECTPSLPSSNDPFNEMLGLCEIYLRGSYLEEFKK